MGDTARMPGVIIRFRRDERGGVLVFVAVTFGVILGLAALVWDLGRASATQTELQSFVDHVALAAGGELDLGADSITRATAAAQNLIAGRQTFADGAQGLGTADFALSFHATLPSDDTTPLGAGTTTPQEAIFVQVTATPRRVGFGLAQAAGAALGIAMLDEAMVSATAVASLTQFACDITPLFFCLPSPTYRADDHIGEMINLRGQGGGAAWGAGNFGFIAVGASAIDPDGPCAGIASGPQRDQCLVAAVQGVTQCFNQRGVTTSPGQAVGLNDPAFNVRFDIFNSSMNSERNNPDFAPAPNVVKGIVSKGGSKGGGGNACVGSNSEPSPDTEALPRDTCMPGCGRFGDGAWDIDGYFARNHGIASAPAGVSTRYETYLWEIDNAAGGSILPAGRAESGLPSCSSHVAPSPDRRVFIAAGVDCAANPVSGGGDNVPVQEYFKIFLTEPTGGASDFDIFGEVIGSAGGAGAGGSDALFHDVVQLYR